MDLSSNSDLASKCRKLEKTQKDLESTIKSLSKCVQVQSHDLGILEMFISLHHGEEFRNFRYQNMKIMENMHRPGQGEVEKDIPASLIDGIKSSATIPHEVNPEFRNQTELIHVDIEDKKDVCLNMFQNGTHPQRLAPRCSTQQFGHLRSDENLKFNDDADISDSESADIKYEFNSEMAERGNRDPRKLCDIKGYSKLKKEPADDCDPPFCCNDIEEDYSTGKEEPDPEFKDLVIIRCTSLKEEPPEISDRKSSKPKQFLTLLNGGIETTGLKKIEDEFLPKSLVTGRVRVGRPKMSEDFRERRFSCDICDNRYLTKPGLRSHKLRVHCSQASPFDNSNIRDVDSWLSEQKPNHKCQVCKKTFNGSQKLQQHKEKNAMCASKKLRIKKEAASKNNFSCLICSKYFLREGNWKRHVCTGMLLSPA